LNNPNVQNKMPRRQVSIMTMVQQTMDDWSMMSCQP